VQWGRIANAKECVFPMTTRSLARTVTAALLFLVAPRAAVASSSCLWQVYKPPNLSDYQLLTAVDAVAGNDVWAAGYATINGVATPYFEHFDGTNWTTIPAPKLQGSAAISGIAHFASNDVWAVGWADVPLTLHWDGRRWKVFPNPAGGSGGQLFAIVRVGRFLYADGFSESEGLTIEKFDGTQWVFETPYVAANSRFQAIAGSSPSNVWAGGYYAGGALIERRDPKTKTWVQVASPAQGCIESMSARSAGDVWAVGTSVSSVQRWNGKVWRLVKYPRSGGDTYITQVSATADTGYTWFTGIIDPGSSKSTAFVDRYLNGRWEETPIVQVGTWGTAADLISPVPGSADLWAVGYYEDGDQFHSYNLAELWSCPSGVS